MMLTVNRNPSTNQDRHRRRRRPCRRPGHQRLGRRGGVFPGRACRIRAVGRGNAGASRRGSCRRRGARTPGAGDAGCGRRLGGPPPARSTPPWRVRGRGGLDSPGSSVADRRVVPPCGPLCPIPGNAGCDVQRVPARRAGPGRRRFGAADPARRLPGTARLARKRRTSRETPDRRRRARITAGHPTRVESPKLP